MEEYIVETHIFGNTFTNCDCLIIHNYKSHKTEFGFSGVCITSRKFGVHNNGMKSL